MVLLTFVELQVRELSAPSAGEVVKLIRVMFLATRYVCRARADLWDITPRNKYMVAPDFGRRTGMPRARFDSLWTCLTFNKATGGGGRGSEEPRSSRLPMIAAPHDGGKSMWRQSMLVCGLKFIWVVQTATRGFPVGELSALKMPPRGDHVS